MNRTIICFIIVFIFGNKMTTSYGRDTTNNIVIEYNINPNVRYQIIDNFSASDAWRTDFIGKYWPLDKKNQIADLLFRKSFDSQGNPVGMGLSNWRVNIEAGSFENKEYSEVKALNNLLDQNNFTMRGIYLLEANGYLNEPGYTIYCTNDYFAFLYDDPKYADFGFALIKANTTVPVYTFDETGNLSSTPTDMTMDYDACYEFRIRDDGSIYFMKFIGPVETESTQYKYVDSLPTMGEVGILYITEDENGKMMVYEWAATEGKYEWKVYSEWYDTVGDFYVSGASATFYLSSSVFTAISASLYEKADPSEVNELDYVSSNTDILSALANGIFGWGYQPTNTWMDYITRSYLTIEKEDDTIKSANIGLGVMASLNGGPTGEQKIYYTYSNFGSTSFKGAEDMINSLYSEE